LRLNPNRRIIMRRIILRPLVALLLTTLVNVPVWPQEPFSQELKIEIQGQPESTLYGYSVRLYDMGHHAEAGHSHSESGGVFTVRGVPAGDYTLEISNAIGEVVKQELIRVNQTSSFLRINLPQRQQAGPAAAEATRAIEIGAPNVLDLCNRALAEWGLHRYQDAMRSADRALRLDGNAATAHFVLGTLLAMDAKTLQEGIRHLERAVDGNPA